MTLFDAIQTRDTLTENGMVTNSTSLSKVLDLFFTIGAVRPKMKTAQGRQELIRMFEAAYAENPLLTRKLLFWARDVRGGAGEREAFRVLLAHAASKEARMSTPGQSSGLDCQSVLTNLNLISEFGRWDDVFVLLGTKCESAAIDLITNRLRAGDGLLAKWMPRLGGKVSAEKRLIANKVRRAMNMSTRDFRKMLVKLTNVVESDMCAKQFDQINYEHVPSLAMARYSKAFSRNDFSRFTAYKASLVKGEAKVNVGAVCPYDILKTLQSGDAGLAVSQWDALPNFMEGSTERVLPVCDVSGSMDVAVSGATTALDICIALGLYISERNVGPFKDGFITFSASPKLQYLTGDLRSRYAQLQKAQWDMNTNLEATFDLILNQATKNSVSPDQMPTMVLIMSDMQFDRACSVRQTALDMIREKYENAGYEMPKLVFWNLNARGANVPVQIKDANTALISGFSPSILKSVLAGQGITPIGVMMQALSNPRYDVIS